MKRVLACVLMVFLLAMNLVAATEEASDVIVLLDTSSSVIPYFDIITDNVLCGIARNYIRPGDTFHLISFGSTYKLETAQTIQTREDVESIVSRFMLLYPLDSYTDFLAALQYTSQYVSALRVESQKSVIVISDGIQDPAPEASSYTLTPAQIQQNITETSEKMKAAGWNIYYIKLPLPAGTSMQAYSSTTSTSGDTTNFGVDTQNRSTINSASNAIADSTGTTKGVTDGPLLRTNAPTENNTSPTNGNENINAYDLSSDFVAAANTTTIPIEETGENPKETAQNIFNLPIIEWPADMGKQSYTFTIPLKITNPSDKKIYLELNNAKLNNKNILAKNSFLILEPGKSGQLNAKICVPRTCAEGAATMSLLLGFAENQRVSPQQIDFSVMLKKGIFTNVMQIMPIIAIIIAVLLLLLLLLLVIKKLTEKTGLSSHVKNTQRTELQSKTTTLKTNSIPTATLHNTPEIAQKIQYTAPDTSSYHKSEITYNKPSYGSAPTAVAEQHRENLYDETAMKQAAQNQKGIFAYTFKKNHIVSSTENTKKSNVKTPHFAAADPNTKIAAKTNKNTMLELYVYNQSRMIGKRNVHIVKPGQRHSIGGGTSSFLVFLVKFPHKIAELRYDGETCSLAIFKPEYFPNETTAIIENCINREFNLISNKGYPVTFKFREYEDPIEKYNRLIQSIKYD